ncbi:hypothetical protein APUTEX25_001527 [Auxenochlorella protothecoides]|uniref:glutathione gamma-glutamylcysteinyltransferase n=1 Tax=Auxenochlorella protothecoides TaxID=3075 RepID=A0A3M7KP19_AUXPR|nr:hypothetical protein APUTEX25_001527 [Auxenochlorella protothecoides]|eukprot:RMZ52137.1 hypothetical protein APUTEX25_001527 [Auxenochlorella protothecoides]
MDTDMPSSPPARLSAPLSPPGVSRTFYKRQLPCPPAIEFSSEQGKHIFAGALAAGGANTFFKLIEQFRTQDEPAFCGLASVAMVLNSLAIDPRRAWKGPWRWFHEEMLDCCHPLARVREEGVTLDQAACLAHCNGAAVEVYPSGCVSLGTFRDMVRDACASGTEHIIVAYCRADFGQTGDGHHSPVGAYSEAEDLVLILDTARFKYPPHWVPLPMLYRSMARIDKATGRPRGFMRLGHRPRLDSLDASPASPAVEGPLEAERLALALLLVPELEWRSSIENEDLLQAVLDLVDLSQHRVVGFEVRYLESQYQQLTLEEPAGEAPLGKALGSALLQRETGGGQQRQEAEQQAAGKTKGLSEALHGTPLVGQDAAGEGLRAVQ